MMYQTPNLVPLPPFWKKKGKMQAAAVDDDSTEWKIEDFSAAWIFPWNQSWYYVVRVVEETKFWKIFCEITLQFIEL